MGITGEDVLLGLWRRIETRFKTGFFICLITGIITHFYMLSNKITNLDDIVGVPDVGGGAVLGRWLQQSVHMLFTEWASPAFNGMMSVILLAVSVCFIIYILDVKSVSGAALCAVSVITLPSVASNMYYMYLSPTFSLAILMCVVSVSITKRFRFGWIYGSALLVLSMACYQAYFALAASLYVLMLLLMLLSGEKESEVLKKGVLCLLSLCISMAGYLISLNFTGEKLSDYKGLSSIGKTPAKDMIFAAARSFHRVIQYFITSPESYMQGACAIINRVLCLLLAALLILRIYNMFAKKDAVTVGRIILLLFLLITQPFSWGVVYLMAPELSHASTVMTFSYVCFDLMIISLSQMTATLSKGALQKRDRITRILALAAACLILVKGYACARVINIAYYRSYIAQTRMTQYYSRIFSKLEAQEGYTYGDRVAILGGFYPDPMPLAAHDMDGFLLTDLEGATLEDHLFLQPLRTRYIQIYLGIETPYVSDQEKDRILTDPTFTAMPSYPENGCIKRFGDIWVVKAAPDDR